MLLEKIKKLIKESGAIPFDKFMSLSNAEYYNNSNPLGSRGDFTTAPEISQVFGELIGLWLLDCWLKMDSPQKCHLVELGAGRGTLLKDILRATKNFPHFHDSLKISIVEINAELIRLQKETLSQYKNISWVNAVENLAIDSPVLIYSNEFFDALPTKQYLIKENETFELHVDLADDYLKLVFLKSSPLPNMLQQQEEIIYETSPMANSIFNYLVARVAEHGGAFLTIDYGYEVNEFRNTIRGYKNHEVLSVFEIINGAGKVDFTYNVNFAELAATVVEVNKFELITQRAFLENLGIHERAANLLKNITDPKDKADFNAAIKTLIAKDQMGEKFKALCVSKNIPNIAVFRKK
ncbi:MAG: SAM-dependent methyltransferase [Alphaproteobacteria bacterium]|jgi:NADH dehydrogenase [ubiquinone] 1 alpha subcomplex assembly factor 7|nr:SAM-dependent methyltransferase [Alphaproteobacteria bacterium]